MKNHETIYKYNIKMTTQQTIAYSAYGLSDIKNSDSVKLESSIQSIVITVIWDGNNENEINNIVLKSGNPASISVDNLKDYCENYNFLYKEFANNFIQTYLADIYIENINYFLHPNDSKYAFVEVELTKEPTIISDKFKKTLRIMK